MTGKIHAGISLLVLYGLNPTLEITPATIPIVAGAVIGSYLPDCDTPKSPAGWLLPLHKITYHRGPTHSIFVGCVVAAICFLLNRYFGLGVFIGYMLHLMADATTKTGIKAPFFPFVR